MRKLNFFLRCSSGREGKIFTSTHQCKKRLVGETCHYINNPVSTKNQKKKNIYIYLSIMTNTSFDLNVDDFSLTWIIQCIE